MGATSMSPRWVVHPDEGTVHVWVERPPSAIGWERLLDTLSGYVADADLVLLEGPGWRTSFAHEVATVLQGTLAQQGVPVVTRTGCEPQRSVTARPER